VAQEHTMNNRTPIAERPAWLQDFNSMLVSAVCHLTGLIALGLVSIVTQPDWSGIKLHVNTADGLDAALFEDAALDATELDVQDESAAAAAGPVRLFDVSTLATADLASLEELSENAAQASGLDGLADDGAGDGEGVFGEESAQFFGIGGYGQTFVYVVDCSGSMSEDGKFERAIYELLRSIEQLASDQRYFVIFYNDEAYPMDADQPVPAIEEEFARTRHWIHNVRPDGGTEPLPALLFALSLRPDAIYFLSDGQFDRSTLRELRMRNRPNNRLKLRQIPIHTIALVNSATEGLMRTIARNSGGQFRFVK
jgi:hypothetical protein